MTFDLCAVCGVRHNLWMSCRTARRLLDDVTGGGRAGGRCPTCDHQHAGPDLGGICVGCPCPVIR